MSSESTPPNALRALEVVVVIDGKIAADAIPEAVAAVLLRNKLVERSEHWKIWYLHPTDRSRKRTIDLRTSNAQLHYERGLEILRRIRVGDWTVLEDGTVVVRPERIGGRPADAVAFRQAFCAVQSAVLP